MKTNSIFDTLEKYLTDPSRRRAKGISDILNYDFHKVKLNENDVSKDSIKKVLKAACIDEIKYLGRFVNAPITAYEFLQELALLQKNILSKQENEELSARHTDINTLIAKIDSHKSKKRKKIIFAGLLVFFAVGQLTPFLSYIPDILRVVSMVSDFLPYVMAFYTAGIAGLTFYQQLKNGELFSEKFIENFFYYSGAALDVTAYAVAITVSATSPIAGILFVAASMARAFQEIIKFNRVKELKPELSAGFEPQTLEELEKIQQLLRSNSEHSRDLSNLKCDIVAATLMVGIIGVWCFVPGALLFSIAAMVVVIMATKAIKAYNDNKSKKQLMVEFEDLENKFESSKALDNSVSDQPSPENSPDKSPENRTVKVIQPGSQGSVFSFFGGRNPGSSDKSSHQNNPGDAGKRPSSP